MSKNNTIKRSDKKYIRTQKALIRRTVLDAKKQQEMIDALYTRFMKKEATTEAAKPKATPKKSVAKKSAKAKK